MKKIAAVLMTMLLLAGMMSMSVSATETAPAEKGEAVVAVEETQTNENDLLSMKAISAAIVVAVVGLLVRSSVDDVKEDLGIDLIKCTSPYFIDDQTGRFYQSVRHRCDLIKLAGIRQFLIQLRCLQEVRFHSAFAYTPAKGHCQMCLPDTLRSYEGQVSSRIQCGQCRQILQPVDILPVNPVEIKSFKCLRLFLR